MPTRIGNLLSDGYGTNFAYNVWDKNDIAPAMRTFCGGGQEPLILEETEVIEQQVVRMVGRNPDNPKSRESGLPTEQRLELKEDGVCGCLTNVQKDNMIMEINYVGNVNPSDKGQNGNIVSDDGVARTVTIEKGEGQKTLRKKQYRIRKITPLESFRLMNFDDADYYAAESVNSNTQLYKQAGNSIDVSCLCAIFSQLGIKGITPWNEMSEDEKKELTKVNRCENPGYERNPL